MAENDITMAEAMDDALANLRLEGIEPSAFTHEVMARVRKGEITLEEARQLGTERFTKLGKSNGE